MRFYGHIIVAMLSGIQIPDQDQPMKIEFLGVKDGCPKTPTMWHSLQDAMKELNWDVKIDTYLFPFEIVSILLLAAIVGAVILAKKKLE